MVQIFNLVKISRLNPDEKTNNEKINQLLQQEYFQVNQNMQSIVNSVVVYRMSTIST